MWPDGRRGAGRVIGGMRVFYQGGRPAVEKQRAGPGGESPGSQSAKKTRAVLPDPHASARLMGAGCLNRAVCVITGVVLSGAG